jgi:transcriptional regulator with XRE-family HTH domain
MSDIDSPAVARQRVRLALRSARQAKQLTQGQVAQAMEWSLSKVMRIEKGDVNVAPNDLKALLDFLEIKDPTRVQRLTEAARASRHERWTIDPADRQFLTPAMNELFQFEAGASAIRYYQNLIIPGILQTSAYAAALFDTTGGITDQETIAARISSRQRRLREVLYRPDPPQYLTVLDESVLRRPIGGPAVMADQLEHLLRLTAETPLQVRILSYVNAASLQIFYGAFVLIELDETGSVFLYRETGTTDEASQSPDDVDRHRAVFEDMWAKALDDDASSERIAAAIAELRTDMT